MSEIDWPYAYDLYQRVTAKARVNGTPLGDIRFVDGYALWPRVSQMALSDDLKFFSVTKRFEDVRAQYDQLHSVPYSVAGFFVGAFAFIVTCVATLFLVLRGYRVIVYGVDKVSGTHGGDFRMQGVYDELAHRAAGYVEVLHTILGASFFKHLLKRRRAAIYLEGIDWLYLTLRLIRRLFVPREKMTVTGLESYSADEQKIAAAVIQKYIGAASLFRFRHSFLRFVFRESRVKLVLAIDDTRHYQELMIAARERSIPSYAFQHGQISPYFVGWLKQHEVRTAHADALVVWNQYWKDELIRLKSAWSDEHLLVGGSAKGMSAFGLSHAHTGRTVLIPYEIDAPLGLVRECIERFKKEGVRVLLKLRHDVPTETQLVQYMMAREETVEKLSDCPPVTAVIGAYSTFLYDAMMAGIPVGVIMSPLLFADGIVRNRLAIEIDPHNPMPGLRLLTSMSDDTIEAIQTRMKTDSAKNTLNAILDRHL